ncbi:bestrophin-like domain [Mycolicibacterium sarraceniae]|uniref:Uncharacterized protein n=1 Tax=Mycolicibacterium sarraceniae TaxID=1534348 RepID=A0A7I7SMZ4_9MYCO|nr:hypothetical protein [Mycolicibacterium sarraceniae]BBY57589.1 hypothetical protein MSAR_07250 [Mycolicibacterium sarraceniae]
MVRRQFPVLTRDEHNDVTKFTDSFIGFVYAFLIGFIVSSMWGQTNTADANARPKGRWQFNLDKISQARTLRLLTAREDTGPPWPLWAVIFLTRVMGLGTVIIYGVEKPGTHYPMVAIVGVIVATNLLLLLELSHRIIGGISTTNDPLDEVISVLGQPSG